MGWEAVERKMSKLVAPALPPDEQFIVISCRGGPKATLISALFDLNRWYVLGIAQTKATLVETRQQHRAVKRTVWTGSPAEIAVEYRRFLHSVRVGSTAPTVYVSGPHPRATLRRALESKHRQ